jgi:uncharacterized RDD family membrane protein YckC
MASSTVKANRLTKSTERGMLGQYAGFFTRAVALILDLLIVLGLILVLYWSIRLPLMFFLNIDPENCTAADMQSLLPQLWGMFMSGRDTSPQWLCSIVDFIWTVMAFFAGPVYFIFFYSTTGQTIGMYIMGLRVVRTDGKHMTLWGSVVRWFGIFLSALPLGLGFLWVLIDDRRQGWHDKLAHTCVIYAWNAEEDNFIIARFKRWLWGERAQRLLGNRYNVTPVPSSGLKRLDLLTIAFPDYDRLDDVLGLIQSGINNGSFHIVNATVLAKGANESVGVLAASDLNIGSKVNNIADEPLILPDHEIRRIMADVPQESFVVAVMVEDHYGDALVRTVSREASALVRRYDIDQPAGQAKKQYVSASKVASR